MKSVTSNVGEVSFKYDSTITIELSSTPVLVPDYIVDVLSERLGDNISVSNTDESTEEVAPEATEEVETDTFASETEELTEDTDESTEEVAPEATEEVETKVEAPAPKKRGRQAANTK